MISIKNLVDMVCSDAVGCGLPKETHFDASLDEPPSIPERRYREHPKNLPPINYSLQLIKNPDGSYKWIEYLNNLFSF